MKSLIITSMLLLSFVTCLVANPKERQRVSQYLQDISVTIRSEKEHDKSEGSGVLINRTIDKEKITFVWTCAHVIKNLRSVRTVIDHGSPKKIVEFDDVRIIKELIESGRRVGEIKMDAIVLKYSPADDGEDLALLMVRAKNYGKSSAKFYLNKEPKITPIGTPLYHVGSLLGQMGANSMTTGIVSQIGRIHNKVEFDQTTVTAFPGSSGGGVFLQTGEYVGMIARGAGEGFNLMVPIRRMERWAKKHDILWALNSNLKTPSIEEILKLPIENQSKVEDSENGDKKSISENFQEFPFLIKHH